jgi:hypothetical protein
MALAAFDAESRFRARSARGSSKRGLELLDKLDRAFAPARKRGDGQKGKR